MKKVGFRIKQTKKNNIFININILYFLLIFFSFSILCFIDSLKTNIVLKFDLNINQLFSKNLVWAWDLKMKDFLSIDFEKIWTNFFPINSWVNYAFFSIENIKNSYINNQNIIKENRQEIIYLLNYIIENKNFFSKFTNSVNNEFLLWFLDDILKYKDDIFQLLWENEKQTYLIIFENEWEKRPNWWFFWSFWVLNLSWWIFDLKIHDSYELKFLKPDNYILWPSWLSNLWEDNKIWFISSNRIWFSDFDWENIISLYNQVYKDEIRWVIFLKSSFLEKFFDWFEQLIYEWQFINSSIDLIRWEELPFKKEFFLEQSNDFFEKNKYKFLSFFIDNFETISKNWYVNIYLKNINDWLKNKISQYGLEKVFQQNKVYFYDKNLWYNKIDRFIKKTILVKKINWEIVLETDKNYIDIDNFEKWKYNVYIVYELNVPDKYLETIKKFEEKYWITLWDREKNILWLSYNFKNKWIMYFWNNIQISNIRKINKSNDKTDWNQFLTNFWKWYYYNISIKSNNSINILKFVLTKDQ